MWLDENKVKSIFTYQAFIPFLAEHLCKPCYQPARQHLEHGGNAVLIMPAWNSDYFGVKTSTLFPGNPTRNLPTIQGIYSLFDGSNGSTLIQIESGVLTKLRTAAASALASQLLSRQDSVILTIIGNGALAPELIKAHSSVRNIQETIIWGRNRDKTETMIKANDWTDSNVEIALNPEEAVEKADIVSCSTSAKNPVIFGAWCKSGQHIDLVGSYKQDHRESDDELIGKSAIYIDTIHAIEESGDLWQPIQSGRLEKTTIRGSLKELVEGKIAGRESGDEITLYKSVGYAQQDLALAEFLYNQVRH